MASKVQICNLALSRIRSATITSLTDGTPEGLACNVLFDDIAEEVMAEGHFPSTIKRASLAATTTTPEFQYTYEYQLPVDPKCLKVIDINYQTLGDIDWVIEGDKLLTSASGVKIRYVGNITDTSSWDVWLKRAVVARLASELATALIEDDRKAQLEYERYEMFLAKGLSAAGQQGSLMPVLSRDLLNSRI